MKIIKTLLVAGSVVLVQLYSDIFDSKEVKVAPQNPQAQAASGPIDMKTLFKQYGCDDPVVQEMLLQKLTSQSQRKISKHYGGMAHGVAYGLQYELSDITRRGAGKSEGQVVCEAQSTITASSGKQRSLTLVYSYGQISGRVVHASLVTH
jgi:hypothetical protein